MVVLTKSDIINGASEPQEVYIPLLKKSVLLKPLTDGQYSEIKAIKNDIGKIKTNVSLGKNGELDIDKTTTNAKKRLEEFQKNSVKDLSIDLDVKKTEEAKFLADCKTVAYGLSIQEKFYPHDVENMTPIGVVHEIANAVIDISKLSNEESLTDDVKDFRDE